MNEHVRKLVKQAKKETDALYAKLTRQEFEDAYNQKFADLIVQECVKLSMRSVSDDEPKEAWYLIEEHFGVKE